MTANLVTEERAAEFLGVEPRTLQAWRARGGGPLYVRISHRCVRYRASDLEAWVSERVARHTSEETEAERARQE